MSVLNDVLERLRGGETQLETFNRQGDCRRKITGGEFAAAVERSRRVFRGWTTSSYSGHRVVGLLFRPEETIEFLVSTFAAISERFTVVPFYPNWSAEVQLRHLREYRIRAMVVGEGFYERVESWKDDLDHVIRISSDLEATVPGQALPDAGEETARDGLPDSHPSAWIFTSGTSGEVPKCTVISLRNIAAAVRNIERVDFIHPGMSIHSPLSTSHIFAFAVVLGILAVRPRRVLFSDVQYLARLPEEKIGRIDGLILVPVVLNRMRSGFYEKLVSEGPGADPRLSRIPLGVRRLLKRSIQRAEESIVARESGRFTGWLKWPAVLLSRQIFGRTIARRLGSPKFVVVGGAKPNLQAMAFLDVMGIRCLQGWGMTETTGALAVCKLWDRYTGAYGTCGDVFADTRAYLEDGELVVEGPQVAEGYMEPDGTFVPFNGVKRTGDYAEFDARGRLKVLGKVADRITLTNGLNYNPVHFEQDLVAADLSRRHVLEEAVIVGDGQPRLGCIFFLREGVAADGSVRKYLAELVRRSNRPRVVDEQIGPWAIHPQLLRDSGFMGPSGKIRRRLVEQGFVHLFEERRRQRVLL